MRLDSVMTGLNCTTTMWFSDSAKMPSIWSNYSDLTRPHTSKGCFLEGKSPSPFRKIPVGEILFHLAKSIFEWTFLTAALPCLGWQALRGVCGSVGRRCGTADTPRSTATGGFQRQYPKCWPKKLLEYPECWLFFCWKFIHPVENTGNDESIGISQTSWDIPTDFCVGPQFQRRQSHTRAGLPAGDAWDLCATFGLEQVSAGVIQGTWCTCDLFFFLWEQMCEMWNSARKSNVAMEHLSFLDVFGIGKRTFHCTLALLEDGIMYPEW